LQIYIIDLEFYVYKLETTDQKDDFDLCQNKPQKQNKCKCKIRFKFKE